MTGGSLRKINIKVIKEIMKYKVEKRRERRN
jgi:hypothetical protein